MSIRSHAGYRLIRLLLLVGAIVWPVLQTGCAGNLQEFYPDTYFNEDGIYENKPLRFSIRYRGSWTLIVSPENMIGSTRKFAEELQARGAELLYAGVTAEGTQGTRAIAININTPNREYAEQIRRINSAGVTADSGLTEMIVDGMPMVRWDYQVEAFRFVEFFFTLDTYNLRIAFWSKPGVFEKFESVYLDIIASLSFVDRY